MTDEEGEALLDQPYRIFRDPMGWCAAARLDGDIITMLYVGPLEAAAKAAIYDDLQLDVPQVGIQWGEYLRLSPQNWEQDDTDRFFN